jgi:2-hydroxy-3-keto-5-methylthiopentenyl-1-phosphate phosphatase
VKRKVAIICDFDGTVSARDVGHHFFGAFVPDGDKRRELLDRWKIGLISSRECLEREIGWVQADRRDLDTFIEGESLDPYFKDFIDFCNRRKYEFLILSDGLDYYIDRMLMKFGLGFLDFRANHLVVSNGSLAGIEFPYYNTMECTMCGNCKRYHVELMKKRGFFSVYVGNGYSDRCPSGHADLVFAKGDLLVHCRQERIPYIPFDNFRDVEREVTKRFILSK